MIYKLTSSEYHAVNAEMPEGIEFGYEDQGFYFFDDYVRPYFDFDIDSILMGVIGQNYDEFISGLESIEGEYIKIYDLIKEKEHENLRKVPKEHNYNTGLQSTLFPLRFFNKGELQNVKWYSDKEKTNLILNVDIQYQRDPLGFAIERTTTRTWYMQNGQPSLDTKISKKTYDEIDKIKEGKRRRDNIVDNMMMPILGMMVATFPVMPSPWKEKTSEEIIQTGRDFLKLHQSGFSSFINESHKKILEDILNAPDVWLDNPVDQHGTTIRSYMLKQMNLENDPTYM